jgi:hypothetical protein
VKTGKKIEAAIRNQSRLITSRINSKSTFKNKLEEPGISSVILNKRLRKINEFSMPHALF